MKYKLAVIKYAEKSNLNKKELAQRYAVSETNICRWLNPVNVKLFTEAENKGIENRNQNNVNAAQTHNDAIRCADKMHIDLCKPDNFRYALEQVFLAPATDGCIID